MKRLRLLAAAFLPFLLLAGCRQSEPAKMLPPTETVYDCPALPLEGMSRQEISQQYLLCLEDGAQNGYTPVVVYVDPILTELVDNYFENAGGAAAFRDSVLAENFDDGAQRLQRLYEELEELVGPELLSISESELEQMLSSLGGAAGQSDFPSSSFGTPYLLRVPTAHAWEIFAWVPFCGWNSCPEVPDMIAICKYWQEQYGAVPAVITYDTLSFYLPEPVTDQKTAIALALEQTAFCDGVFEAGSPVYYAVTTLNSNYWRFWWD